MISMFWNRLDRAQRGVSAVVGLLLFLSGSNFCLLTVLSGGGMACLSVPGAAAAPTSSHCGHGKAPAGDSSASSETSPCCVNLARVIAPEAAKAGPAPQLFPTELFVAAPAVVSAGVTERLIGESPPNRPDLAVHRAGRAPPLS